MILMASNKLICIVGMCGSGKSIVADELVKAGYGYRRFGQITLDEVKRRGLPPSEALEKEIREGFRKQHGMAAYAILNIPIFDELLKKGNCVGDNMMSWSEYKVLKEKYGNNLKVVAVYAPPKARYERLGRRMQGVKEDPTLRYRNFTEVEAKSRDYAEIENIEKGGPIAMADFLVVNTGTMEEAIAQTRKIIKQLSE